MTQSRILSPGIYGFRDVEIGDKIQTDSVEITADLIDRFADLSGDQYAIHMDDATAREKGFPNRVAHGLLVLSTIDGLKNNAKATLDGLASLGWTWRFEKPVFVGDVIHAELTIHEKRRTQSAERGILRIGFDVLNAKGVRVQSGYNELIFDL